MAGWAPVVGLGILVAGSLLWEAQELRRGPTPWTTGVGALSIGLCALGVMSAHRPYPSGAVIVGAWWTAVATLGVAGFMLGMGIGGLVGLDEDNAPDALAIGAVASMGFGMLSFAPAQLVLATGVYRARRLPTHVAVALLLAALALPTLLLAIGFFEEHVGDQALVATLLVVGVAWITVGQALRSPIAPASNAGTGQTEHNRR